MAANPRDFEVTVTTVRKMYVRAASYDEAEFAGFLSIPDSLGATDIKVAVAELPLDPPTVTPDWFVCETLDTNPCRAVCARTEEDCADLLGITVADLRDLTVGFDCAEPFHSYGTSAAKRHPLKILTEIEGKWFLPDGTPA